MQHQAARQCSASRTTTDLNQSEHADGGERGRGLTNHTPDAFKHRRKHLSFLVLTTLPSVQSQTESQLNQITLTFKPFYQLNVHTK